MDDLDAFIAERKAEDPEFARGFELGYQKFKLGVLLRQAREEAGLTQDQVAQKRSSKADTSTIENEWPPRMNNLLTHRSGSRM